MRPFRLIKTSELNRSEARIVRARALRLLVGVYDSELPEDQREALAHRAAAALLVCPPGSVVCGITALAIAGCRIPDMLKRAVAGPIHVLIPRCEAATRRGGINGHHSADVEAWGSCGGVEIAHPGRCWVQVVAEYAAGTSWRPAMDATLVPASWCEREQRRPPDRGAATAPGIFTQPMKAAFLAMLQLGDGIVDRKNPLISYGDFVAHLDGLKRIRGLANARLFLSHVRAGTDSLMETWLRAVIVDAGFPCPEVNRPVLDSRGRIVRYLDLSWPDLLIDLEYQGEWHEGMEQQESDTYRREDLDWMGWNVMDVTYADLKDPSRLIDRLHQARYRAQLAA
jgi:hypothetical protein